MTRRRTLVIDDLPREVPPPRGISEVKRMLAQVLADLYSRRMDPKLAYTFSYAANAFMKATELEASEGIKQWDALTKQYQGRTRQDVEYYAVNGWWPELADCICFPEDEQPELMPEWVDERKAIAAVECPMHGKRFREILTPIGYQPHWLWDQERNSDWQNHSAPFRKAMRASFPEKVEVSNEPIAGRQVATDLSAVQQPTVAERDCVEDRLDGSTLSGDVPELGEKLPPQPEKSFAECSPQTEGVLMLPNPTDRSGDSGPKPLTAWQRNRRLQFMRGDSGE